MRPNFKLGDRVSFTRRGQEHSGRIMEVTLWRRENIFGYMVRSKGESFWLTEPEMVKL